LDLSELPQVEDLVSLLRSGRAPIEVRRFAARGVLPLDAADQIRALLVVLQDPDLDIAASARAAFGELPPEAIIRSLASPEVTEAELDAIARGTDDGEVLERVVQHRNVSDATLTAMARTVTGTPQEVLIVNQARLLRNPSLIDALFENPGLSADGRRMLNELKEEFFEKEARRRDARSRRSEKPAEPETPPVAEEVPAGELEEEEAEEGAGKEGAPVPAPAPDAEASPGAEELYLRLMGMTVPERVKLALTGTREERRFLIADGSKMVGFAVLRARGLTPSEVESFCGMRHLDADIFQKIATAREWIRRPLIALALVKNPKVPLMVSLPLVKRLGMRDLRNIARDRNLPEAVRAQARKIYLQRRR
jgi:hypothetical protein